jgi:HAD superfamily hydrolase (TIGR01509 family)
MTSGVELPAAVVFDCDGTLVDTERVTDEAVRTALASLGLELTDADAAAMRGRPWPHTRRYLVDRYDMADADVEEYLDRYAETVVPRFDDDDLVFDDAVEVLDELRAAGVPVAVCTASGREHLERILSLAPLRGVFRASVAREDTTRQKPDPAPYLTAIGRLGDAVDRRLEPAEVSVVEDTDVGTAAGVAAGCWTVGIDRGARLHDLDHADVVVERLTVEALVPDR